MAFKRGFKSWCETISAQQRKDLGLEAFAALDPMKLASALGAKVLRADEIPGVPKDALRILLEEDSESWSAITISLEGRHLIVLNPSHTTGRISSDLMHELAHLLIGHKPSRFDISEDNLLLLRYCDGDQEAEANWLAGALLLPREALLHIRRKKLSDADAAKQYHSSKQMLTYRMQITGVNLQARRSAQASV